ncbi:hypothetical protein NEUTE1DRAFT_69616 [Neurospora tetrasperma FGSC 2508]|uniref:Uncharacterized protein n=1 Tax=Neurospora tetrasperma (strain FGSC 2508 / ATCC MYA-4615 / P0657) TaxID=510951 RepID=F8MVB0_NEUT8|nr:uncharacterized protein NEUTE1DRAFT_69616 [Neurospora tetrasperma FGSC 2508]EGO54713.1 hypothetical protein NEUTE1DRAFT_69616 [Neurospora tetrasperma FGSC 2508]EGZ67812.1 hypothetical protein NEUTE2DRAFT_117072 [Neurospora tetrasperma FGSC 2509]
MPSKPTGTPSSKKPKPLFILPKSHFDKAKSSEDPFAKRPPTPYYPPARQSEGESSGVGDEKEKDQKEDIKDAKKQN